MDEIERTRTERIKKKKKIPAIARKRNKFFAEFPSFTTIRSIEILCETKIKKKKL